MTRLISLQAMFTAILLSLTTVTVPAADFSKGVDAYTAGDYDTAFAEFQTLAEQGHLDAQNNLGVMYNTGRGVPQDNHQAARWYLKAAERGHADAQANLAALYAAGKGVPKDYLMAYAWFNLAANQGDQKAQHNRDLVASNLAPEDINKAQNLSLLLPPDADEAAPTQAAPSAPPPVQTAVVTTPAAPPPPAPTPPAAKSSAGQMYGPIAPGSTLWSIAKQLRPDPSISTEQMVLALHRINPGAFTNSDISNLKVGAMLRIPSITEINRIDKAQARSEVQRRLGN